MNVSKTFDHGTKCRELEEPETYKLLGISENVPRWSREMRCANTNQANEIGEPLYNYSEYRRQRSCSPSGESEVDIANLVIMHLLCTMT